MAAESEHMRALIAEYSRPSALHAGSCSCVPRLASPWLAHSNCACLGLSPALPEFPSAFAAERPYTHALLRQHAAPLGLKSSLASAGDGWSAWPLAGPGGFQAGETLGQQWQPDMRSSLPVYSEGEARSLAMEEVAGREEGRWTNWCWKAQNGEGEELSTMEEDTSEVQVAGWLLDMPLEDASNPCHENCSRAVGSSCMAEEYSWQEQRCVLRGGESSWTGRKASGEAMEGLAQERGVIDEEQGGNDMAAFWRTLAEEWACELELGGDTREMESELKYWGPGSRLCTSHAL